MRRVVGLCLLAAFAAFHATGVVAAAVATGSDGDHHHHHPGCPWEMRDEPCPHALEPAVPDVPAWTACPADDLPFPVDFVFMPARTLVVPRPAPPVLPTVSMPIERTRDLPIAPDPEPPRGSFPIV